MKRSHTDIKSQGFSLIEVLVALIVLSVGLLGIAKMQALAISSTSVASSRSLAAIEAASLAASIHANRGFWISAAAELAPITVAGKTVGNPPAIVVDCTAQACGPDQMAAYDVQEWAKALNTLLHNDQAIITCPVVSPPACTVQITWSERTVVAAAAATQQQINSSVDPNASVNQPTYTLYVEP
jgi:type IV pilus assembly protein PilV